MNNQYDAIVIGAGSGGIAFANRASEFGAKLLVVESHEVGGTCVNRGCVPKKIMWYASEARRQLELAKTYGHQLHYQGFDWQQCVKQREAYIQRLHDIYFKKFSNSKVTYKTGHASFENVKSIKINDEIFSAEHIIIATGSTPVVPEIKGKQHLLTSDDFFELNTQPKKVAIIGSGYIGVELAGIFQGLGTNTHLFIRHDIPLRRFDRMIGETVLEHLKTHKVHCYSDHKATEIIKNNNQYSITCQNGSTVNGFDYVFTAVGRHGLTAQLNLSAIGLHANQNGTIDTDDFQNTAINNIYAIGDVTDRAPLTPVAIAAGRRLAHRLFNNEPNSRLDYNCIPSVIFTHPPVASVGISEQQAHQQYGKDNISIYNSSFTPMLQTFSEIKTQTNIKLICLKPSEKILGLHIVGDGADEMLQGFSVAIKMGATKQDFDNTVAIHPTSSEEVVTLR